MENTANLGLFKNTKLSQNTQKESMRTWREDIKRHKTVYISVNNNTNFYFFRIISINTTYMGWINPKNHLTLLSL